MYVLGGLALLVIIVGVGVYLYVTGQQTNIVRAQINTTQGVIQIELYSTKAPKTVSNFVSLVNSHFYDDLVWHRIMKGFVIQTGDPTTKNGGGDNSTWGNNGSNQSIPLEIDNSLHNYEGYIAMARTNDPNSASSQFYINLVDNSASLDPNPSQNLQGYAVFGKVTSTSGMDVALAIGNLPTNGPNPAAGAGQPNEPLKPYPLVTSITITA
jgi:cyclophilin family peptidyl-prolyl cis-trans isomerase